MLDATDLSRLKWRSRRGMLENDLVLQTFYERHERALDPVTVAGLKRLLELGDNDLWDLVAGRDELPSGSPAEMRDVLAMLRACEAARQG